MADGVRLHIVSPVDLSRQERSLIISTRLYRYPILHTIRERGEMRDAPPNMTDYEETRRTFNLDVPERFNFGFDVVDKWAEDHTKLALVSLDPTGEHAQKHTFWEMKVLSNKFANLLRSLDVRKGDRVFIMAPRIPEWYAAVLGMMKLGVVPMPATTMCTPHDIEYRINRAEASVAITDLENAAKVEEIVASCPSLKHIILVNGEKRGWINWDEELPRMSGHLEDVAPTNSDDPLLIYFTSGTVGQPKMVLHTQASYAIAHIITAKFWQDIKSNGPSPTRDGPRWPTASSLDSGPWGPPSSSTTPEADSTRT